MMLQSNQQIKTPEGCARSNRGKNKIYYLTSEATSFHKLPAQT